VKKWSATFAGQPSYAVITNDTVLVTAKTSGTGYGTTLYALSAADGHQLWSYNLGGTYWWSALTTENGVVYALNYNGVLRAFDVGTGAVRWQQQLSQYSYSAPPVVKDGVVYASGSGSGGTLSAVFASTGGIKWTASVGNGDIDAPSVDSTGVYSSHVCDTAKFSLAGARMWTMPSGCSGGGGKQATLDPVSGRLYVRNYGLSFTSYVVNANTGATGAIILTASPYAVSGSYAYTVANGVLLKVDPATGSQLWSMGGDANDSLVGAPVVVNGTVIVGGTSGKVYGISASNGARVLTSDAGASVADIDEQNVSQPTAGTAVGQGLVTVTTANGVVAFGN
jgi:outer membrane protein assembly factor BamB